MGRTDESTPMEGIDFPRRSNKSSSLRRMQSEYQPSSARQGSQRPVHSLASSRMRDPSRGGFWDTVLDKNGGGGSQLAPSQSFHFFSGNASSAQLQPAQSFHAVSSASRMISKISSSIKHFRCVHCNSTYSSQKDLQSHVQKSHETIHAGVYPSKLSFDFVLNDYESFNRLASASFKAAFEESTNIQDATTAFKRAALLHTGSQGITQNFALAKQLYTAVEASHPHAANNLAVILQHECSERLRRYGVIDSRLGTDITKVAELYNRAASYPNCDKARANLALLLWRGPEPIQRNVTRAIELLQQAVYITQLPRHKVLLARVLLSDEAGANRDAVLARTLLEEAMQEATFMPAMRDLASLLTQGRDGVLRDLARARRLDSLALLQVLAQARADGGAASDVSEDIEEPQLVLWEEPRDVVEDKLRAAKAKQSQVFLLTLGGAGRGKTSVVRSLRGMPFVSRHDPTELAAVARFQVLPGGRHLTDKELEEMAFQKDSLRANLSRVPGSTAQSRLGSASITTTAPNEWSDETPDIHPVVNSESRREGPQGERDVVEMGVPIVTVATSPAREFRGVLSKVSKAFGINPLPIGPDGALVQCWDLGGQSQYVMAHALFVKNGNVFVFVVNLERLLDTKTSVDEMRELCRWMQLVHALVEDAASVRPIIVGTHKDSCTDMEEVEEVLYKGLLDEAGDAVYDNWVRVGTETEGSGECRMQFVALENSTALENPSGSGLLKLEEIVKGASDGIVAAREEVPARWVAFVEELERSSVIFLNKSDISKWVDGFPAFDRDKGKRDTDALKALRYFSGLGRLVLFELSEDEVYLFPHPTVILDFVRRVTGPEASVMRILRKEHASLLGSGLLTHQGLKAIWQEFLLDQTKPDEMRIVMLDLLCRFDLLMRLQPAQHDKGLCDELIGIPALLPKVGKWLQCAPGAGESELRVTTKFADAFPPGLIGFLISHLHKKIGGGRTRAGLLGSDAAILTSTVELKETGRVMVSFVSEQRRLEWKIFAQDAVGVARGCLKAVEEFLHCPLRRMRVTLKHFLTTKCRSDLQGCGSEWAVEFSLPAEWAFDSSRTGIPNLEGECVSLLCKQWWWLWTLKPEMSRDARDVGLGRSSNPVDVEVGGAGKQFDVFISHAGIRDGNPGDKLYIAWPLYKSLTERGLRCFLDKVSLEPGDSGVEKMVEAMETADIGVFILSPEFAARRWTMTELNCFLRRKAEALSTGGVPPLLIPVFYRLNIRECRKLEPEKHNLEDGTNIFVKEGFYDESRQRGAVHWSTEVVKEIMKTLSCISGIENEEGASDDITNVFAAQARGELVKRTAMWVEKKFHERNRERTGQP